MLSLDVSGLPRAHFPLLLMLLIGLKRFFGHQPLLPIGWKNLQTARQHQIKIYQ
jgi:hypothetical protein